MSVDPSLLGRVRERLATEAGAATPSRVAEALRHEGGIRGDVEVLSVLRALQSEIVGAGPLQPLLADPDVTDVLVNAPDEVWVDRGQGLERTAVRFVDDAAVRRLAVRLAAPTGRRLDDAQPWVGVPESRVRRRCRSRCVPAQPSDEGLGEERTARGRSPARR